MDTWEEDTVHIHLENSHHTIHTHRKGRDKETMHTRKRERDKSYRLILLKDEDPDAKPLEMAAKGKRSVPGRLNGPARRGLRGHVGENKDK